MTSEQEVARGRVGSTPGQEVVYPELVGASYNFVKPVIDKVGAAIILLLCAIPMAVIAVIIKATSPGPVFVKQERIGRYGQPFMFWKFRSMRVDAEVMRDDLEEQNEHDVPLIFKMRRDPRVTKIGSLLRRTSLDELPNIFNVLRGEMSLVGPRPPLPREVAHYTPHHMQRLAAIPGMTGLWQIRGRSEIPFEQMVEIDLEYIERWSLARDAYIVLMTPVAVVTGRGAW